MTLTSTPRPEAQQTALMCGRARVTCTDADVAAAAGTSAFVNRDQYEPRYNAQPGAAVPVVRLATPSDRATRRATSVSADLRSASDASDASDHDDDERVVDYMRWGLVPSYASDESSPNFFAMFNARAETLAEKPAFARLVATSRRHRRGVVLLDGFYEWRAEGGAGSRSVKQPYYVHLTGNDRGGYDDDGSNAAGGDGSSSVLLRCAAVYDTWRPRVGPPLTTCAIVTVASSRRLRWLHDRMPAILRTDEEVERWLAGEEGDNNGDGSNAAPRGVGSSSKKEEKRASAVLKPYDGEDLRWHAVTTEMSKIEFQGPRCCEETTPKVRQNVGSVADLFRKAATASPSREGEGASPRANARFLEDDDGGGEGDGAPAKRKTPSSPSPSRPRGKKPAASPPDQRSIHAFFGKKQREGR